MEPVTITPNMAERTLLVLGLDGTCCALDIAVVRRVLPMMHTQALPGAPEAVRGIVNIAGQIVAVLDLRTRFGLPRRPVLLSDVLVLVRRGERSVALAADAVVGLVSREAAAVTPVAALAPDLPYLEGVLKLDDGMALIHDVQTFLSAPEQARLEQALTQAQVPR